jgi:hypothetical protein
MAKTEKTCPLNGEKCDPLAQNAEETANLNCSFYLQDMFAGRCLYIEALKSFPLIAENIKKIKIQN